MAVKRVEINVGQNGADPTLRKLADVAAAAKALGKESPQVGVGANTSVALSQIAALRESIAALGQKAADLRVGLDDKGLIAKVAGIQAGLAKLDKTTARPNVDLTGLAVADAKLMALDASLDKVEEKEAALAGLSKVSWLKDGLQGWTGTKVNLFGGLLPGMLGEVGGLHLLIDSIIEVSAILIPASIAFGAFGLAGAQAADTIYTHTVNAETAITALGGKLPALSGGFAAVQNAVKPQVYTLFGDALEAMGSRTGTFSQLATGAGYALEQFGMRAMEAWKSAGASSFASKAVSDLQTVLHIVGNLGGAFGNILKSVPGTAEVLFGALNGITGALEKITASGAVQGLLKIAMGFHGIILWGGLAATALMKMWPAFTKLGSALTTGALNVASWGEGVLVAARNGGTFDDAMAAMGLGAAGAFGIIAGSIGILATVAYLTNEASDATANWIGKLDNNAAAQSTLQGAIAATAKNAGLFDDRNQQISSGLDKQTTAGERATIAIRHVGGEYGTAVRSVNELTGAQTSNLAGFQRLSSFQNIVQSKFGMTSQAVSLLVRGMTGSTKAAAAWFHSIADGSMSVKDAADQIDAYELATIGMVPTTERARAAVYAMGVAGSQTAAAIQKVTSAEDQLMGLSTGLETAQLGVHSELTQLSQAADKAHASFTGTDSASITLQTDFESNLMPSLQNVKDGLLNAQASSHQMAQVLSTDLAPAVDAGALKNQAFRNQIEALAREAGYNGVNSIKALTGWIDRNKVSASQAAGTVRDLAGNIAKIPKDWHSIIKVTGTGAWHAVGANGVAPIGDKGTVGHAKGGLVHHGSTATADDVLARVSKGELIVPAHMVNAGLVDHLRGHLPGFSAGGIVSGDYSGISPSWPLSEWKAALKSDDASLAKSIYGGTSLSGLGAGHVSGNVAGWIETALRMAHAPMSWLGALERLVSLESGGNPRAVDPISVGGQHAEGLFQTLGSTFASYSLGGSIFNPIADAIAGIRYIMSRYGSPYNIPGLLSGSYHGYAGGGWINEPVFGMGLHSGQAYGFGERGPEYVSPHGGGGTVINITIEGALDPAAVGKQVAQAINVYARHNGGSTGIVGTTNATGRVVKR